MKRAGLAGLPVLVRALVHTGSGRILPRSGSCRSWNVPRPGSAGSRRGRWELIKLGPAPFPGISGHRDVGASIEGAQLEHGEPLQVDRGAEHHEVLRDSLAPAHAGSSPAVPAAHQVCELALDLGARGAVVAPSGDVALTIARPPDPLVLRVDREGAARR